MLISPTHVQFPVLPKREQISDWYHVFWPSREVGEKERGKDNRRETREVKPWRQLPSNHLRRCPTMISETSWRNNEIQNTLTCHMSTFCTLISCRIFHINVCMDVRVHNVMQVSAHAESVVGVASVLNGRGSCIFCWRQRKYFSSEMGGWLSKKGGGREEIRGGKGVVKLRKEIRNPFIFKRTRYQYRPARWMSRLHKLRTSSLLVSLHDSPKSVIL